MNREAGSTQKRVTLGKFTLDKKRTIYILSAQSDLRGRSACACLLLQLGLALDLSVKWVVFVEESYLSKYW